MSGVHRTLWRADRMAGRTRRRALRNLGHQLLLHAQMRVKTSDECGCFVWRGKRKTLCRTHLRPFLDDLWGRLA